jgi:putative endonuclease
MAMFSRMMFALVNSRARRGLAEEAPEDTAKIAARRTGVRGETFAYWYLRRHGYVIVSRNFTVPGMKGEIDLVGYDGKTLAFVEVKTRVMNAEPAAKPGPNTMREPLPEDAMTPAKRHSLVRVARQFLLEWRMPENSCRFDLLAIESRPGARPVVRLHKNCFGISGKSSPYSR